MDTEENLEEDIKLIRIKTKREIEEDSTPLWIKIFGSAMLSVTFLSVITLTGYIVSNINNIQTQVNCINVDMLTKKEFADRLQSILDTLKIDSDNIVSLKERMSSIENSSKDRTLWIDKYESKMSEENKQLQKDIQLLRERVASLEGKISLPLPDKK